MESTTEINYKLRMLGVTIDGPNPILGDNYSVINTFSIYQNIITMILTIIGLRKL